MSAMQKSDDEARVLPLLAENFPEIVHGTVSRHGGVSRKPYASCNVGFGVGDSEANVFCNRQLIKDHFGLSILVSARQVHGDRVHLVREPLAGDCVITDCDAMITALPGVGLMIGHADCQAVVVYDSVARVIAAVHSGWRGSVANIVAKTVALMQSAYGCLPENMSVGISPSLGPCCAEFVNYREELPQSFWKYLASDNHFDFWKVTLQQLRKCGVPTSAVSFAGICTSCSVDYFSYRRARRLGDGSTGRNGTVIAMKN